jgi:transposase
VIPPKANRKVKRACDFVLYCERNLVERFFNKIKHYRAT